MAISQKWNNICIIITRNISCKNKHFQGFSNAAFQDVCGQILGPRTENSWSRRGIPGA